MEIKCHGLCPSNTFWLYVTSPCSQLRPVAGVLATSVSAAQLHQDKNTDSQQQCHAPQTGPHSIAQADNISGSSKNLSTMVLHTTTQADDISGSNKILPITVLQQWSCAPGPVRCSTAQPEEHHLLSPPHSQNPLPNATCQQHQGHSSMTHTSMARLNNAQGPSPLWPGPDITTQCPPHQRAAARRRQADTTH